ncbi:MAG: response regulator, partial [Acidobacteriota bacterium]|nr:response regulator [Acidobacteriota bacterium]
MAERKKPINVLVVDDEQFFAEWLAENLQDQPNLYNAQWVNSGERALQWIQQQPVDLVISDIKMAGVSGIELLKQIRRHHPGIGVILMTGYALPELQQEAVKRGSLFYLEKPFPMERLESAIEQAMASQTGQDQPEVGASVEPESAAALSLLDTLHLFHVSRAHKTLLVRAGASEGLIYYQDGEIVHAVTQDQTGEPAFRQIINWQSNDYAVFTDEPPPTRTIFRDFDSLLSAAAQPGSMPTPTTAAAEQQQTQQQLSEVIPDAPQPLHEAPVAESQPAEQLADEPPPAVIQQETSDSCGEIPSTKPEIPNVSDFESGISDFPQRGT